MQSFVVLCVQKQGSGRDLLTMVAQSLDLYEMDFFGLVFYDTKDVWVRSPLLCCSLLYRNPFLLFRFILIRMLYAAQSMLRRAAPRSTAEQLELRGGGCSLLIGLLLRVARPRMLRIPEATPTPNAAFDWLFALQRQLLIAECERARSVRAGRTVHYLCSPSSSSWFVVVCSRSQLLAPAHCQKLVVLSTIVVFPLFSKLPARCSVLLFSHCSRLVHMLLLQS